MNQNQWILDTSELSNYYDSIKVACNERNSCVWIVCVTSFSGMNETVFNNLNQYIHLENDIHHNLSLFPFLRVNTEFLFQQ